MTSYFILCILKPYQIPKDSHGTGRVRSLPEAPHSPPSSPQDGPRAQAAQSVCRAAAKATFILVQLGRSRSGTCGPRLILRARRGSSRHCCHSRARHPVGALTIPPSAASRTHRSLPDLTNPCRGQALLLANLPRPQRASVFSPWHLLSFFKVPKPLGAGRQGPGSAVTPSLPVLPASSAAFNQRVVFPACVLPPVPPALARAPREAADFKAFQAEPQHFPGSCSRARHRMCPLAPPTPPPSHNCVPLPEVAAAGLSLSVPSHTAPLKVSAPGGSSRPHL